jgi:hypothetical protein
MATMVHVWRHIPHVILRYPYAGMDYQHDPEMMMPPVEDWDYRGMYLYLCFLILIASI